MNVFHNIEYIPSFSHRHPTRSLYDSSVKRNKRALIESCLSSTSLGLKTV